jgi:ribosomal protein S18 acetylase RimI-like enzyme
MDASFEGMLQLDDGRRLRVRWIRPEDAALLREGFGRLSRQSRLMRFFVPMRELSDRAVRYFTEVDGVNHAALIAVSMPERGVPERGYGVARFVRRQDDPTSAELAITVTDDAQHHGLGRRLARTLAVAARERGIETFLMSVLDSNADVRRWLRRVGAEARGRDGTVVEYRIPVSRIAGAEDLPEKFEHDANARALLQVHVHGLPNDARRG